MKFGHTHMLRFKLNLGHLRAVGLRTRCGIACGTEVSSNLTITSNLPPFSHNVATKQNIVVGWKPEMANVLAENNGAWHTALATPIKLVGALDLRIKLDIFLVIPTTRLTKGTHYLCFLLQIGAYG
jgi:hypothetical protein